MILLFVVDQYPDNTGFLFWISDVEPLVSYQDTKTNCVTLHSRALMFVHKLALIYNSYQVSPLNFFPNR